VQKGQRLKEEMRARGREEGSWEVEEGQRLKEDIGASDKICINDAGHVSGADAFAFQKMQLHSIYESRGQHKSRCTSSPCRLDPSINVPFRELLRSSPSHLPKLTPGELNGAKLIFSQSRLKKGLMTKRKSKHQP